jgi:SAM-dependent methyltransferase
MSLLNYYEESYKNENDRKTSDLLLEVTTYSKGLYQLVVESKERFLSNVDWNDMTILETGSGRGGVSLLLSRLGARVTILDFSQSALEQAEKIFQLEGRNVETILGDVTHPDIGLNKKFDLVIDSHLLHCLAHDPDRSSYYRLIGDHLSNRGIFVAETMVHRKKLFIPDGFMFDEKNVLWQMLDSWTPVRRILDSLDLESELNLAHFDIIYFYYYGQFGFVPHRSFMDLPSEILPAAVRFVVRNRSF